MSSRKSSSDHHPHPHLRLILLFGAALLLALFWYSRPASAPVVDCTGTDTRAILCTKLTQSSPGALPVSEDGISDLRRFYAGRAYAPAWSGSPLAEQQARAALSELAHAHAEGLSPSDYNEAQLSHRQSAADFDLSLSDAVLRYAHDLRLGRVAAYERGNDVSLPAQGFDFPAALEAALRDGTVATFLAQQEPILPQYLRLKGALATYREFEAKGGWHELPSMTAKSLDANPSLQDLVRARLSFEDPTIATGSEDLTAALERFQRRNGLKVDGRIGKDTLAALNASTQSRVDTIEANMERWRWMPRRLENRYIMVNVPATELEVVSNGNVILTSRVVAGRPADPTPIVRAEARGIVVNPPWNVPAKIAAREIFPKMRRNPDYMRREGMVVRNGSVQQLPGPKSALGAVKIDMPNPFMVYLHDTPVKSAFARDNRNLSHGCVRVQQILPLASVVLGGDPELDREEIESAIADHVTKTIPAPSTTPVYFAYWTAFVDDDGTIEFRRDIYGRDSHIIAILHRSTGTRVTLASSGCARG